MLQLNRFTDKSKRCLLKSLHMAQECGYRFVEPQILMASIANEGRDLLTYTMQYFGLSKIDFCKRISETIATIDDFAGEEPTLSNNTQLVINTASNLTNQTGGELIPIEFLFLSMIYIPSSVKQVFDELGIEPHSLKDAVERYRRNTEIENNSSDTETERDYPFLTKYARNLCKEAQEGRINKAIGRDNEIRKVIHILSRQTKNNPILVGEPGTGKTAVVEGLAHRIIEDDVPREIRDITLYFLDVAALVAGASHVGEYEERIKGVIEEVSSNGNIVLFIDEIHLLIGGGGSMDAANIMKPELARGAMKVIGATTIDEYRQYIEKDKAFERRFTKVSINEPDEESALAILRGVRLRLEKFHNIRIKDEAIKASVRLSMRYIQDRFLPDKAIDLLDEAASKMKIARSSSPVELDSLRRRITTKEIEKESLKRDDDSNPTINLLQEEISNLKEEENALHAKWQNEKQLLSEIQTRRNEIAVLKESQNLAENQGLASSVVSIAMEIQRLESEIHNYLESLHDNIDNVMLKPEMDEIDVMNVLTEWTGIPVYKLSESETEKLAHIEEFLDKSVIGQKEAKLTVSNAIRRNRMGFGDENKPIGTFLFLGTTGVGKTELCKALAEFLFNSRDAFVRIDMSEYQQEHEVSKLFGAPPGYIGYEAGGQLTEAVRQTPYSVVLFDEIEKAHPKVFETLLQVLDDGRMTDGKGRTVNFKNTIIIMTSNLGHQVIYSTLHGKSSIQRPRIGFTTTESDTVNTCFEDNLITDEKVFLAKKKILSELKTKVAPEFINRIDDIVMFLPLTKEDVKNIAKLQIKSLVNKMRDRNINLHFTEEAVDFIVEISYQPEYGARPIKRAINSYIIDDLSTCLISGVVSAKKEILINKGTNSLLFTNIENS